MQVSAYQSLDIVCECLADAGTASGPHSKLRRQWQPQALRLVVEGQGLGMGLSLREQGGDGRETT